MSDFQRWRVKYIDRLVTSLTALMILIIFVLAPLHTKDFRTLEGLAIVGLLVIIGGAMVISANAVARLLLGIAFVTNVAVFLLRLLSPDWPYNLHLLAAAWFVIALTLGAIIARAVFRRGRVTYHRIV